VHVGAAQAPEQQQLRVVRQLEQQLPAQRPVVAILRVVRRSEGIPEQRIVVVRLQGDAGVDASASAPPKAPRRAPGCAHRRLRPIIPAVLVGSAGGEMKCASPPVAFAAEQGSCGPRSTRRGRCRRRECQPDHLTHIDVINVRSPRGSPGDTAKSFLHDAADVRAEEEGPFRLVSTTPACFRDVGGVDDAKVGQVGAGGPRTGRYRSPARSARAVAR